MKSLKAFGHTLAFATCLLACAAPSASYADTYLPSVKIGTAALITPAAADTYYGSSTTHTDRLLSYTGVATARPVELVELARALKNDPDLIYEYVHNNIDVVWMYGLQKGALGASIDKAGTPFDQANLMVELLRQAGYTAGFKAGTIQLTGTQFQAWTGITNAKAACQLLSSGGIPAQINGSTLSDCSYDSASTVSQVVMSHIWVTVSISGTTYVFDPSYKTYTWKAGINLATAAGMTSGVPLSQATSGMDSGTSSGASYVHNLNGTALNTTLQTYASNLLTYLQNNNLPDQTNRQTTPLSAGEVEDVIGGGTIDPYNTTTSGSLRQTSLPYTATAQRTWSGNIPDQYRTSLSISSTMENYTQIVNGAYAYTQAFSVSLYADETYGRRLVVDTDFPETSTFCDQTTGASCANIVYLKLDDYTLATYTNPALHQGSVYASSRGAGATITLSANHPYAAAADGTSATTGDYMDTTLTKAVTITTPLTIVDAWGDTSAALLKKWGDEMWRNKLAPTSAPTIDSSGEQVRSNLGPDQGDMNRTKTAASWLAQYTRQAHMNAQIGGSLVQLHHALGVVFADTNLNVSYPVKTTTGAPFGDPNYTQIDSFDRIDVDAGISVTSKTADAATRRAVVQSIATSSAALEGSISQQMADLPDTSSTATRFAWGNSPPSAEDPSGAGARAFFQFNSSNYSATSSVLMLEGVVNGTACTGVSYTSPCPSADYRTPVSDEIQAYAQAGYTVVASRETFLGPGQRGGGIIQKSTYGTSFMPTKQRGGAFVATRYVNGEPVEIAHIVSGVHSLGSSYFTKGGGGGVGPGNDEQYNPSQAADILKSRFVDRSSEQGVNLSNGGLTFKSPVTLKVGNGGFPYELSATLEWNSAPPVNPVAVNPPTQPLPGLTHNWTNNLAMSSSGMEAMGSSDVRAAVGTIVAFLATQDIYKGAQSAQRDVAAVLAQAWWVNQISGNTATVSHGTSSRQFVKVPSGQWIAPGAGSYATLTQTGARTAYVEACDIDEAFVSSRGWDYSNMSFDVKNSGGDVEHFSYWRNVYYTDSNGSTCGHVQGFRLTQWTFPQGVTVNLVYGNKFQPKPGNGSGDTSVGVDQLVQVNNSLGRAINFSPGAYHVNGFDNNLSGNDLRSVTLTRSGTQTTITDQSGNAWVVAQSTQTLSRPFYPLLIGSIYSPRNTSTAAVQYVYDNLGRVKEVDDANRLQLGTRNPYYFYIADGTRGMRDDPLGNTFSVVYDTKGRPWRFLDELSRETTALYDGRGRVTSYTYPESDCEQLGYDDHNNPIALLKVDKTSSCNKSAGSTHVLSVSATWDQTWNKPLTVTDAKSQTSTFTYYSSGSGASLIHTATRPNTGVYTFTYNSIGKPLTVTDPTSLVTSNTYDSTYGNLLTTAVNPSGINAITTLTYDAQGDVLSTNGPRTDVDDTSYATFDANRRPVFKISPDPDGTGAHLRIASKTTYDSEGHEIQTDQGKTSSTTASDFVSSLTITTTYDPVGNKIKVTTPTSVTQFSYDGDNRSECTAVRMNRSASGTFGTLPSDACTLSTATTYGNDRITKNIYDVAGQLRQIVRAWGDASLKQAYASYKYSANGKQRAVVDADGSIAFETSNCNATTCATEGINADAAATHQTNYYFDGFDRPYLTQFADSTYEQLGYDNNGNVTSRRNRAAQTLTYGYNAINLMISKVVPVYSDQAQNTVTLAYDLAGRPTSQSDTLGNIQTNGFDTMKRVTSTAITIPGLSAMTVSYQYDLASNRTRITWPDGYYVTYAYDAANRMTGGNESGSTALAAYDYDDLGHPAWVQYAGTGAKVSYSWTAEGDLVTLGHAKYDGTSYVSYTDTYTPARQITASTISSAAFQYVPLAAGTDSYTANGLNQYATVKGQAIGYDANGNLTSDGTNTFTYDPENHLTKAVKTSQTAVYSYDPNGHRTKKVITGGSYAGTVYYLSSGDDEIAEYDGSGALAKRYVPGLGIDQPIAQVTAAGVKTFFHQDKTGSVIAMTDTAGAMVEGPYTYDAFGNCVSGGVSCTTGVAYKYTGRRFDPETGLYYYRARYYSSAIGRFLQTDPIGYKDDINWYAYVGNDPTNKTDPTGLSEEGGCGSRVGANVAGCKIVGGLVPGYKQGNARGLAQLLRIARNPTIARAIERAWQLSNPGAKLSERREVGFFVLRDKKTGELTASPFAFGPKGAGGRFTVDLGDPPQIPGQEVVANFHTHPLQQSDYPFMSKDHSYYTIPIPRGPSGGPPNTTGYVGDIDVVRSQQLKGGIIRDPMGVLVYDGMGNWTD